MSRQITHRRYPDTGHMVQIVSAEELRRILLADGESLDRPDHFGDDDEWDVGEDEALELEIGRRDEEAEEQRLVRLFVGNY